MKHAFVNGIIHTGNEILNKSVVIIENGVILSVQKEIPKEIDIVENLKGDHLSAGFIDIQINRGQKLYFSQSPTEETIHDIYESNLKYGTTHTLPCLISSSKDTILQGIEAIQAHQSKYKNGVLGMHLEGPFLNPLKCSSHGVDQVRKPTISELEEIIRYGKDVIKVITIAPECFTEDQLDMLLESGIAISAGHSTMTYKEAQSYFSKGIKLVSHLFNAKTQFGHQEPGLVGATLENETVYAPIILDGVHCDYATARLAYALIKKDNFFLISDSVFLGRKVSNFKWDNFNAHLENDFYRNDERNLERGCISMDEAVRNAYEYLNITIDEAIKMATCRVASAIKMEDQLGKIKSGYPASFVRFNDDLSKVESLIFQ
jgi:N-acetylglucosamine-6-phosphate deacetylase